MAGRALKIDPKKVNKSEPADGAELSSPEPIDESSIATLAHQLWIARGCPIGSDQEDWFQAENQLRGRNT